MPRSLPGGARRGVHAHAVNTINGNPGKARFNEQASLQWPFGAGIQEYVFALRNDEVHARSDRDRCEQAGEQYPEFGGFSHAGSFAVIDG